MIVEMPQIVAVKPVVEADGKEMKIENPPDEVRAVFRTQFFTPNLLHRKFLKQQTIDRNGSVLPTGLFYELCPSVDE